MTKTREDYEIEDLFELLWRRGTEEKRYMVGPVIYAEVVIDGEDIRSASNDLLEEGDLSVASRLDICWDEDWNMEQHPYWLAGHYTVVLDHQEEFVTILKEEL